MLSRKIFTFKVIFILHPISTGRLLRITRSGGYGCLFIGFCWCIAFVAVISLSSLRPFLISPAFIFVICLLLVFDIFTGRFARPH